MSPAELESFLGILKAIAGGNVGLSALSLFVCYVLWKRLTSLEDKMAVVLTENTAAFTNLKGSIDNLVIELRRGRGAELSNPHIIVGAGAGAAGANADG